MTSLAPRRRWHYPAVAVVALHCQDETASNCKTAAHLGKEVIALL